MSAADALGEYKRTLQSVLDNRPSGTRQRLALAIGKNRSFVSQIANPAYSVPVPARHIETIFDICHFSPDERRRFLDAYARAHPQRARLVREARRGHASAVTLPDLGDAERNRKLEALVADFVQRLAKLLQPD